MTTLYIAGPMSGIPSYNFPAFYAAARSLRMCGYDVVSPAEMHEELPGTRTWHEYLRDDLRALLDYSDGVALLHNWSHSVGASFEVEVAQRLLIPTKLVDRWIEDADSE